MKKVFESGIHEISNQDYHASEGISRSALMKFKKSPYHYWYEYLDETPVVKESSPALVFGELLHTWCLEPNQFEERFVVAPTVDKRTRDGKAIWGRFTSAAEAQNLTVITQEQFDLAEDMTLVLRQNSLIEGLIADAKIESSIYFNHSLSGLQCKVRPDIWHGSIIGDLKTTVDASYRAFQGSAYKYGYYLQAGMIHEALQTIGIEMEKFIIIAAEKDSPYAFALYILDEEAVKYGVQQFDLLMENMARCKERNEWPGYGIRNLCIPQWAKIDDLIGGE